MKKCPACAEEIQDEAIKCKHCGEFVNINCCISNKTDETFGLSILFIPICTSFLIWFWVGGMNLLEGPGSKLNLLIAVTILGTATLAAIESNKLGMGNPSDLNKKGERNSGPIGWFFSMVLLWIAAYPVYLWTRSKYGLKNYLLPGIFIALTFVVSLFVMSSSINQQVKKVQQNMNQFQSQNKEYGNFLKGMEKQEGKTEDNIVRNPIYSSYYKDIKQKIGDCAEKLYLKSKTAEEGEVAVSLVVTSNGQLLNVEVIDEKSSESSFLRNLALESVRTSSPFLPFPEGMNHAQSNFKAILSFELNR